MLEIKQLTKKEDLSELKDKYLFIDTSVFVDVSRQPKNFTDLFQCLKESGCYQTTIVPVLIELLSKTESLIEIKNIKTLAGELCSEVYDNPQTATAALDLIFMINYCAVCNKNKSIVDYLLACLLKQFPDRACVLTANHSDFPLMIFNRLYNLENINGRTVISYGIYQFSQEKYDRLVSLVGSKEKSERP